jgi:hypothetical protein
MIWPAIFIAGCCAAVVATNAWRYPANPLALMRATLAGVWGVGWLAYGLNATRFPQPEFQTLLYLGFACGISIVMIPRPGAVTGVRLPALVDTPAWRWYFHLIVGLSAAVALWDLWHLIAQSATIGLQQAIIVQRLNRGLKAGGYSLPGMEAAHSIAAVTGALGYALWLSGRSREGAVAAALGLLTMVTSTGRWDVVAYGLWCLVLEAMFATAPRRFLSTCARVFVLLAIFFYVHGELLSKIDSLRSAAEMSADRRATAFNTPEALGARGKTDADGETFITSAPRRPCQQWVDAADNSSRAFVEMGRAARVFVLYFAGPLAAFDRSLCEDRPATREVIFYWPLKMARVLHLVPQAVIYVVDPFIDIGIPYNDYTLFYPFWDKFGGGGGMLAWLITALSLRWFIRTLLAGALGLQGVVASVGPFAIAVRGLWVNAFFDGSLVVYTLVAIGGYVAARAGQAFETTQSARPTSSAP